MYISRRAWEIQDKEYENTRHNIGFDVIDRLAEEENIAVMESKHKH